MILSIEIRGSNPRPRGRTAPVNKLQDLMAALAGCWSPPPARSRRASRLT